jgi:hypothetical protein
MHVSKGSEGCAMSAGVLVRIAKGQQTRVNRQVVYDLLRKHGIGYRQASVAATSFHHGGQSQITLSDRNRAAAIVRALGALEIRAEVAEAETPQEHGKPSLNCPPWLPWVSLVVGIVCGTLSVIGGEACARWIGLDLPADWPMSARFWAAFVVGGGVFFSAFLSIVPGRAGNAAQPNQVKASDPGAGERPQESSKGE